MPVELVELAGLAGLDLARGRLRPGQVGDQLGIQRLRELGTGIEGCQELAAGPARSRRAPFRPRPLVTSSILASGLRPATSLRRARPRP